jgi:hypothetical protein
MLTGTLKETLVLLISVSLPTNTAMLIWRSIIAASLVRLIYDIMGGTTVGV